MPTYQLTSPNDNKHLPWLKFTISILGGDICFFYCCFYCYICRDSKVLLPRSHSLDVFNVEGHYKDKLTIYSSKVHWLHVLRRRLVDPRGRTY